MDTPTVNETKMNPMQAHAVARVRAFLENHRSSHLKGTDGEQSIVEFVVERTEYGTLWVKGRLGRPGLPEGNLLRALDSEYWLFSVGKRGAVTVKMCSKSCEQFNGKRAFGFEFVL